MTQKFWNGLAALAALFAAMTFLSDFHPNPGASAHPETALERVNRTGVLRCGYILYAPYLMIDLRTGQKSGIGFDLVTALADEMGVRVDWVEETGWGNFHEGLNAGRYDMLCSAVWASGAHTRIALLTSPVYTIGLYAFARADDRRFDAGWATANDKSIKIADIEGDVTQHIRHWRFPEAQELALSPMVDHGQYMLNVAERKADVAFDNLFGIEQYNKGASTKVKVIESDKPVYSVVTSFAVRLGETDLKAAIDASLAALFQNGAGAKIFQKYPGIRAQGGG